MKPLFYPGVQGVASPSGEPAAKIRVLVADEHDLVRRGLVALVNAEPDMVACGETADLRGVVGLIERVRPDVVLIDISPRASAAIAGITAIRRYDRMVGIVGLSMSDRPEHILPALSAGASGWVLKVDVAEHVLAAVRRARIRPLPPHWQRVERGGNRAGAAGEKVSPRSRNALDPVEQQIVALIGTGVPTPTIAVRLRLSRDAVQMYLHQIRRKLHFLSAIELVQFCARSERRARGAASNG